MKSNLSLKLFLAFERYFIENDEVISLDKSSEFTDVIVGIGFLPHDMSENTDFKKKILKKYGFSSATALAEDFRKRVLNLCHLHVGAGLPLKLQAEVVARGEAEFAPLQKLPAGRVKARDTG